MNKPSDAAMLPDGYFLRWNDGSEDGLIGFNYFTIRGGKILPSLPISVIEEAKAHISASALAEHKKVIEAAEHANNVLHLLTDANSIKSTSVITAYGQIVEARAKLTKALASIAALKTNEKR